MRQIETNISDKEINKVIRHMRRSLRDSMKNVSDSDKRIVFISLDKNA